MNENIENQPSNPAPQDPVRVRKIGAERETVFVIIGVFLLVVLALGLYLIYLGQDSTSNKLALMEQRMVAMEQRLALFEKQQAKLHEGPAKTLPEKAEILEKVLPEKEKTPILLPIPPSPEKKRYHEVQKGETLFRISRKYGISMDDLRRTNNLPPEAILVRGQKLLIDANGKS